MRISSYLMSALFLLSACASATVKAPDDPGSATAATPVFGSLDAALAGPHRSDVNRARDAYRHPRETLSFFGVAPGQRVIELWPGRGWYTEVLAPLLHDQGSLVAAAPDNKFLSSYREFLGKRPDLYGNVEVQVVQLPDAISLGPDESVDVVLTFRNVHNWLAAGYADALQQAVFKVLKPGGVYGVVEHRGAPGMTAEQIKTTGYVPEADVVGLVTRAGFVLEESSEINANSRDTKEYPKGVWTLPPVLSLGEVDKAKYLAIGESDRMTLRFRKPAKAP